LDQEGLSPDAPKTAIDQDLLERRTFVAKLASSLVLSSTRASGIVLGLCGDWGAGKTSLLNFLHTEISGRYLAAVVVKFNPWLALNTGDMISSFVKSFAGSLLDRMSPRVYATAQDQLLDRVADHLVTYGNVLSPALNLMKPGLGIGAKICTGARL
jgi:predicted KAP-like P-loop ATPase